ncbi:MAG: MraY family glycosyltransferase [Clostridia bacterium]
MSYLYTFLIAFLISLVLCPFVIKFATAKGIMKVPKRSRDIHHDPVPLLGGIAIIASFGISVLVNYIFNPNFYVSREVIGLATGIILISVMGILDDIYDLRPLYKAIFQTVAAAAAILVSGSRIVYFTDFGADNGLIYIPSIVSFIATVMWIFLLTNAFNIIDGLDGLTAGTTVICCITLFFITFLRPDASLIGEYIPILLIALVGATAGFLPYNFNPARLYLGETGAAFLGFTVAVISIQGTMKAHAAISIFIPVLAMGLPILDIALAYFRRIIMKKPIAVGDSDHIHHRLLKMGFSQKKTVLVLYACDILFGAIAILLSEYQYNRFWLYFAIFMILISIALYILYSPLIRHDKKHEENREEENEVKND